MPTTKTFEELAARVLKLADLDQPGVGPSFLAGDEDLDNIRDSLASLWDMIVHRECFSLLSRTVTLTADGSGVLLLPTDHYKFVRLHVIEGGQLHRVEPLPNEGDEMAYTLTGSRPRFYRLEDIATQVAAPVLLYPAASAAQTFRLRYVPEPPEVRPVPTGEVIGAPDGVSLTLPNRWFQWLEYDAAARLAVRGEDPQTAQSLLTLRDDIGDAIEASANGTDRGGTKTIGNARGLRIGRNTGREPWHNRGDFA